MGNPVTAMLLYWCCTEDKGYEAHPGIPANRALQNK
jgi:hypothetical protein